MIKDYKRRIVEEAISNNQSQYFKIITKNNNLYVIALKMKGEDPIWYIQISGPLKTCVLINVTLFLYELMKLLNK